MDSICLGEYDKYTPGTYTITIIYGDLAQSFEVTVSPADSVTFDDVQYIPM